MSFGAAAGVAGLFVPWYSRPLETQERPFIESAMEGDYEEEDCTAKPMLEGLKQRMAGGRRGADARGPLLSGSEGQRTRLAILGLITLAAAVLRFWGLGSLSVWGDEFWGQLVGTDAPSFRDYFLQAQLYGASQAPLHPLLEYVWTRLAGTSSIFMLRAPNVVLSLAIIPVAYAVARRVGGVRGGLVAAVCVAISPMQVWHAQSLRPYSLMMLLAGVSIYASLALLDGRSGRWWWCVVVVNVVGVATHWFYALFVGAELAALLLLQPGRWRRTILWGVVQGICLLPFGWYLVTLPPMNVGFENVFSLWDVVEALLDETIHSFVPADYPLFDDLPLGLHRAVCYALPALFGLALVCAAWAAYVNRFVPGTAEGRLRAVMFLYVTFLVPLAVLAVFDVAFGLPFLAGRYVAYGMFVRYAAVGMLAPMVNARVVRGVFLGAVLAVLGYRLCAFLPAERTTNYLGALEKIRAEAGPHDVVVVDSVSAGYNLAFHMNDDDPPLLFAANGEVVVDTALWMLTPRDCVPCREQWPRSVWHVFNLGWKAYDPAQWEQRLTEAGLGFSLTYLFALEDLVLYQIAWPGIREGEVFYKPRPPFAPDPDDDGAASPEDFQNALERAGETAYSVADVTARFEGGRYFAFEPLSATCLLMLQNRRFGMAERFAELNAQEMPGPEADYLSALVPALRDPSPAHRAELAELGTADTVVLRMLLPFTQAFSQGDYAAAFDAAEGLPKFHPYVAKLREAVRPLAEPDAPLLPFGLTPARSRDYDAVAGCFGADCLPCPTDSPPTNGTLGEVLDLLGRPGEAAAMLEAVAEAQPGDAAVLERLAAYEASEAEAR